MWSLPGLTSTASTSRLTRQHVDSAGSPEVSVWKHQHGEHHDPEHTEEHRRDADGDPAR
jgi:hypothetical protein